MELCKPFLDALGVEVMLLLAGNWPDLGRSLETYGADATKLGSTVRVKIGLSRGRHQSEYYTKLLSREDSAGRRDHNYDKQNGVDPTEQCD